MNPEIENVAKLHFLQNQMKASFLWYSLCTICLHNFVWLSRRNGKNALEWGVPLVFGKKKDGRNSAAEIGHARLPAKTGSA